MRFLSGDASGLPGTIRQQADAFACSGANAAEYLSTATHGLRPGALAHCNYLEDADLVPLLAGGQSVIFCPRTHAFFGHEPHPFRQMQAAGINVALGTDSLASSDDLSILNEARFVHSKLNVAPDAALRMITQCAAAALGLEREIGTIEAGKAADLAVFGGPDEVQHDPVQHLIGTAPPATAVWTNGVRVN
jgi:cytosine/adenosine deaminase-related metal-dependent hydrolase